MAERIIHFENAREAQEVVGRREEYLPALEEAFGVQAVARDGWLKLQGETAQMDAARDFVSGLVQARHAGMVLNRHTVGVLRQAYLAGRGAAEVARLASLRVDVAPGRAAVFPRTPGQAMFLETIRNSELTFGLGPAGTGKTWLAMAMAVSALLKNEVARIILTRPAVEAGEALGFLPGDLQQKILPYLRPLYDALYEMMPREQAAALVEQGVIEVAPLAYMRGRTLNRAFIILDEAQNTTREQMLMFLTRLGVGSKAVVNGDLTQVDLPQHKMPGLLEAEYLLRGVRGVGVARLTSADVVRHALVQRIIDAYQERNRNSEPGHKEGSAG